jgi:hypothetical protein
VTNLNDAGMGSLRQAILDTPAGGTVDFQAGMTGTITLTSGELAINRDLTISGPGASVVTVSGNHASRVFDITGTFTVAISGLTIADGSVGYPANGGGIFNGGTLTVTNCTLSGNSAGFGGGILNRGTLTVTDSTLSGNTAPAGDGGGIWNDNNGALTVTGCTLSGNFADYFGGGILNRGTLNVTDCFLSSNSALHGDGGGIANGGGPATVTNSTLSVNSARVGGGAIYNYSGTLTVTDCTLSGNASYQGGGIEHGFGILTVTGSTLSGNYANVGGGIFNGGFFGTVTVTGSTLSGNSATYGGGIYNDGRLTVTDCTLSGNSAGHDGGGIMNSHNPYGGGLTVTNSTLSGNTASSVGSGIYNEGVFAVRGLVTIDGDFFQSAGATLDVRIGGLAAGTDYDQLVVTGLATLGGTLQVKMTNGYRPQPGDAFHPLLWGQSQGAFATYTGASSLFRFSYDASGLTLVAL